MTIYVQPGAVELSLLRKIERRHEIVALNEQTREDIARSHQAVRDLCARKGSTYGVNTGFGKLAQKRVASDQLEQLQVNLLLSHCCGVGAPLTDPVVRMVLLLKVMSLARGYSGVSQETVTALLTLLNKNILPVVPSRGSVGASGDLAPLAHLAATLIGTGKLKVDGQVMPAAEGLNHAGLAPLSLKPKEGLALINGTQVSTALALDALFKAERLFAAALCTGALTVDAMKGSDAPFDERIHIARGHKTQIDVAAVYRQLLHGSKIRASHLHCERVQDPYSLRCMPQVMGAVLNTLLHAADVLLVEANGVTDNPLIFADEVDAVSGGNFHAEPVALVADAMAVAIAEIGALSERRIANLVDATQSGLPAFLVDDPGLNSGFMITQVTAAALASENKSLAHPASVDSLPTSANQEDHVSMATFAAWRLRSMIDNTANILGIELMAAVQGVQ
ncbi:MAG: histidine ammonia-lyase, partial [Gammaproteobacteria bacterium]|nr:histidine ammonia-lyase [Gammaproteobacteria bacterium]